MSCSTDPAAHDPSRQDIPPPSAWLCRFAPLARSGGRALDLACGSGRHARWLAQHGWQVEAVDRDEQALGSLARLAGVHVRVADLEAGPWPYAGEQFDCIVVANYLHRPLLPAIVAALAPSGLLIYETFSRGNERYGRPSNPQFLLAPGELLRATRGLRVIAYEDIYVDEPKPALVQRICAINADGVPGW